MITHAPAAVAQEAPGVPLTDPATPIAYDPWQGFNRSMFSVGMGIDRAVIGPIARGYRAVAPRPVRQRVTNVLNNLGEPNTAMNDVLQGHLKRAGRATARFGINSTIGLLGVFDVATGLGIRPHDSDFGQTLGRYGAQTGPYLYLPVMGPLNLREGVGRVVDAVTDPVSMVGGGITSTFGATRTGATAIDSRSGATGAFEALKDATDPYATTRSAYAQHRAFVVQSANGDVADLPDFDAVPPEAPQPEAAPPAQ